MSQPIEKIGVIGAGTMGHGIAQVAAESRFQVVLFDIAPEAVERGRGQIQANLDRRVAKGKITREDSAQIAGRLSTTTQLSALASCPMIIEAAFERLDVKQDLVRSIAEIAPDAMFASNTSSLSLTEIASASSHPERVVGMHFFNPPPLMKLLEVVRAHQTSEATVAAARDVGARLGKDVIEVRDSPGFASSRLGICLAMEAIRMVEEGVASAADIDKAMRLGYNHPMGPLELTDLVGLDVRLAIAEYLHRELGTPQFHPPQLLRRMVRAGLLGRKSGEGFYRYDPKS